MSLLALSGIGVSIFGSRSLQFWRPLCQLRDICMQTEVVAVLLQLGAYSIHTDKVVSYNSSLLSLTARVEGTRMTE
jgi:hypothetical protein